LCLNRAESLVDEHDRNFGALSQAARPISSHAGSLALDSVEPERKSDDDFHRFEFSRNIRDTGNRSITSKHRL
jgi:hypothetical protein